VTFLNYHFFFVSRDTKLDSLLFIKFKNYVLNQDLEGKIFSFKNYTIIFEGYKCIKM